LREGQANVRTDLLEAGVDVLSSYDYTHTHTGSLLMTK
jgi:hypothetical protein